MLVNISLNNILILLLVEESRKKILKAEAGKVPYIKILILFFSWLIIATLSLLKGGHGEASVVGVPPCGWIYWGLISISFPIILVITLLIGIYVRLEFSKKKKVQYIFLKGDVKWSTKNTILYPILCSGAGIAAGLLGIGGGMVKGPLLLEMGLLPQVVAATSAFMIVSYFICFCPNILINQLFTASSTVTQFLILGVLPWDYGSLFAVLGFVAALLGQYIIAKIIKQYGRPSLLVFLIATIIAVSTGMLSNYLFYKLNFHLKI